MLRQSPASQTPKLASVTRRLLILTHRHEFAYAGSHIGVSPGVVVPHSLPRLAIAVKRSSVQLPNWARASMIG
jgi:hypothetical protein